jgi:hypothetical protein
MILISSEINIDYKKTKIGAILTTFCSDFGKKSQMPQNYAIQPS